MWWVDAMLIIIIITRYARRRRRRRPSRRPPPSPVVVVVVVTPEWYKATDCSFLPLPIMHPEPDVKAPLKQQYINIEDTLR